MVIDSHVHVWSADATRYPYDPALLIPEKINLRGSVETLLHTMAAQGVTQAVIVQPHQYLYDHQYVRDCLQRFPETFAAIALIDPHSPTAPETLTRLVVTEGFSGFRLPLSREPDPWRLTHHDQDPLWQSVHDADATIVALVKNGEQLPILEAMIHRFPYVRVVIDHMAFPDSRERPPYPTFANLLGLAQYPNVFVKVSNLGMASHEPYPHPDVHPFVQMLIEAFDPQRLMWGSDWPLILRREAGGYRAALELIRTHMPFLSANDKACLLYRTAQRVWKLKDGGDRGDVTRPTS